MTQHGIDFEKWADMAKKMQEPFQAIAELNVKTLKDLNYLKPEDLAALKKPEELFEKQMTIAIENGHKALEHMQKSFQIIEQAMLSIAEETKKAKE